MAKDIPTKNTDMSAKWFIIRTWIFDLNLLRDNPLKIWKKGLAENECRELNQKLSIYLMKKILMKK